MCSMFASVSENVLPQLLICRQISTWCIN